MASVAGSARIAIPRFDALHTALSISSTPRFRAASRVRLRTAARHALDVTVLAMVINGAWLLPSHPEDLVRMTVANFIAVGLAAAGFVAVRLRRHARGEEFLAMVRLAQGDDAFATAERVRRVIERLAIAHPSNPPFGVVTASVGGCVVDRARLDEPSDAWFACADRALYEAKRLGRNRTIVA